MRVLIADDSPVIRHLLQVTLQKWGYEVLTATDGAQALQVLQQPDGPNLGILDWMMPGLTGPEVCLRLRQQQRREYTYLLLLTSRNLKEDIVAGLEAGADDYVVKPFVESELKVRLRTGTRILDLQRQLLDTQEALRVQATHDALTKIWNRATVMDVLEREIARSRREQASVAIVMMDLDHFKSINDTHGHFAGDLALQEAVARIKACIRPYDSLGRYGGEEFLVVLPGCDVTAAKAQAERMRAIVASEPLRLSDREIPLSASFGCAVLNGGEDIGAGQLLRIADGALYEAKRRGRNRVEYAALDSLETSRR